MSEKSDIGIQRVETQKIQRSDMSKDYGLQIPN